jgi:GNAT superfamily N-acetyltransferase
MSDVTVVGYEESWRDDLLRLESALWGSDPATNAAHLEWKYRRNPYLPEGDVLLAVEGGRLVGATGLYGTRWEAGDPAEALTVYCKADTVVNPAWRGRGIAGLLHDAMPRHLAGRGRGYLVGTSPSVETAAASLHRGWGATDPIEIAVRPPRRRRVADPFARLDRRRPGRAGVTVTDRPRTGPMAALVAALPWDGRIRHVRDEGWFAWRFDNPLSAFRFLYAGDGDLDGYLVLHTHRLPERRSGVTVVDWEATDDDVAAALLDLAVEAGRGLPLVAATTGLPEERRRLLAARGFVAPTEGIHAVPRPLLVLRLDDDLPPEGWTLGGRRLLRLADWAWREAYSDNY